LNELTVRAFDPLDGGGSSSSSSPSSAGGFAVTAGE
jgi:hypothetical protein